MNYKRTFNRTGIAAIAVCVLLCSSLQGRTLSFADSYTDQISYDQSQINALQTQLSALQAQNSTLTSQRNGVVGQALATQNQINKLQAQVTETQVKVNKINATYATTVSNILEAQVQLKKTQQELGSLIAYLYKYSQGNPMLSSLVNGGNVLKFFDTESNLQSINGRAQALITSIKKQKLALQKLASQEHLQQLEVTNLLDQLQSQQSLLAQQAAIYDQQVSTLTAQESSVTSQSQSISNSIQSYEQQMATAQDEEAALLAQEAANRAAQAGQNQYGSGGTIIGGGSIGNYPDHFPWGQCTWYVATQRYVPWWGNANEWVAGAISYGYPTGMTPEVGSIVVWGGGDGYDVGYGHVAYVVAVQGSSSFTVHEANYYGLGIVDQRQVDTLDGVIGFIYG